MIDIPNYEGLYAITENGNIWSYHSNRFLTPKKKKRSDNYTALYISLYKNGKEKTFIISRLVALTFIPNPNNLPEVDHIDRNPLNNNVNNLRWVDSKTNSANRDPQKVKEARIKASKAKSKPVEQIDIVTNKVINSFSSSYQAAIILFNDPTKNSLINRCANNKKKSAYGYYWRFKENDSSEGGRAVDGACPESKSR